MDNQHVINRGNIYIKLLNQYHLSSQMWLKLLEFTHQDRFFCCDLILHADKSKVVISLWSCCACWLGCANKLQLQNDNAIKLRRQFIAS